MPMDAGALRGRAALAGMALFLNSILVAYLNSTVEGFWSNIYVGGIVVTALGAASAFSTSLGITHGLAKIGAYVTSWVPFVAVWFAFQVGIHYHADGFTGFMAGLAILDAVFLVAFGVTDAIGTIIGQTAHAISDAADEASNRMQAASDALKGQR